MQRLTGSIQQNLAPIFGLGRDVVTSVISSVFGLFLVLMLTAFLSLDRARIEDYAASLVPSEYLSSYRRIVRGMNVGLAGVVRGQLLICITNGALTLLGLFVLDVRFPFLLAMIACVFSLIPIFGSIISTIPIVLVALTQGFWLAFMALLWIVGIHLLEANFLNPKIMGNAARIHPVIVVFALIVGERSSGLVGALFAVPVASLIVTVFRFLHHNALESPVDDDPEDGGPENVADAPEAEPGIETQGSV